MYTYMYMYMYLFLHICLDQIDRVYHTPLPVVCDQDISHGCHDKQTDTQLYDNDDRVHMLDYKESIQTIRMADKHFYTVFYRVGEWEREREREREREGGIGREGEVGREGEREREREREKA